MASLKDLYDSEVIDSIVRNYSSEVSVEDKPTAPKVDPLTLIDTKKYAAGDGEMMFSSVFWQPENIPDVAIPMFAIEDWDEQARNHVPEVNPNWVWDRPVLESFALAMISNDTTLIHGLMGTGKSCLVEQWCATLHIPFWRMSCNRETREQHFLGSPGVEHDDKGQLSIKQEPTTLTDSLKYGGVFCEDEAFRHNSALVLQSLREKSSRTVLLPDAPGRTADERKLVAPKGKWWYVLTDNTTGSGDETGIFDAEVQDASTLDRIDCTIEVDYLSKENEMRLMQKACNLNDDILSGMLNMAKLVRNAFKKKTIMSTISVRGLLAWAEKIEHTKSIGLSLQLSWYNKLCSNDRQVVEDMYHQVFSKKMEDK